MTKALQKALDKLRHEWAGTWIMRAAPEQATAAFQEGWKARQEYDKQKSNRRFKIRDCEKERYRLQLKGCSS